MFYLRTIIFATGTALASALLLQDSAVADPPDWAPAHGYRNKHQNDRYGEYRDRDWDRKDHKHKYHRDSDDRDWDWDGQHVYRDDEQRGYTRLAIPEGHYPPPGECRIWYPDRPAGHQPPPGKCHQLVSRVPPGARLIRHPEDDYAEDDPAYPYRPSRYHEVRTVDQPIFVNGECTPNQVTGAEAGAALGRALGTSMGGGNALATVAGTIAGAMLGTKADAALTTSADEDCFRQVLDRATGRQQVAWDNDSTSTRYELTPVRSYRRSGQTCREVVTTIERQGAVREVYRTACRRSDGRWQLMD